MKYDLLIWEYALKTGLDPALIKAIMEWESNFKSHLVTPESKGRYSYGLMQILDTTARDVWGVSDMNTLLSPRTNIFYATQYLKGLKKRYPHNIKNVIAGYNAGSARFDVFGDYVNQNYVDQVYKRYLKYKKRQQLAAGLITAAVIGAVILKRD